MKEEVANAISTIVFDVGRVLVNIDFDAFPRSLGMKRSDPMHSNERSIKQLAFEYETGKIGTEKFFDSLEGIFRHKFSRSRLLNAWNAIVEDEVSEIAPVVDRLQTKYQIALLSNTNLTHFQKALETSPILRKFSKKYLSYEMGAAKPDEAAYRTMIRGLGVESPTILFIDDIGENIIAARKCGIIGIRFRNVPQLKDDLLKIGIR